MSCGNKLFQIVKCDDISQSLYIASDLIEIRILACQPSVRFVTGDFRTCLGSNLQ